MIELGHRRPNDNRTIRQSDTIVVIFSRRITKSYRVYMQPLIEGLHLRHTVISAIRVAPVHFTIEPAKRTPRTTGCRQRSTTTSRSRHGASIVDSHLAVQQHPTRLPLWWAVSYDQPTDYPSQLQTRFLLDRSPAGARPDACFSPFRPHMPGRARLRRRRRTPIPLRPSGVSSQQYCLPTLVTILANSAQRTP